MDLILALLPVVLAIGVPALGLLATPAGLPVLSWLIGNPVGRIVALIGIAITIGWLAYRIGRTDGVARVQAETATKRLKDLATKVQVKEELSALTPDERRERLKKWVK